MRAWPLLLLLAGCARRDRPFVPSAGPVDPKAGRIIVRADGTSSTPPGSPSVIIDAPGRLRFRDLRKVLLAAFEGGTKEVAALVDTLGGEGMVPLPLPVETSALAYSEKGEIRRLWGFGESMETPGARVRVGVGGVHGEIQTGPARWVLDGICVEKPGGGDVDRNAPSPVQGIPIEDARFIVLRAVPDDLLEDVVLSLLALERRFPGKVVLDVLAK